MNDKLKLIINKLLFDEIGLEQIEFDLINKGIKSKAIYNPDNLELGSKYFFLLNDINIENLDEEEKNKLNKFIIKDVFDSDFLNYLNKIKLKLIMPKTNEKHLNYGDFGSEDVAPSDAIVFAFHYIRQDSDFDVDESKEEYLFGRLNYIQEELAPSKNLKVAIIVFNEIPKNNYGIKEGQFWNK